MRQILSCIVLGTIVAVGAGPAFGQGPSRDEVKRLEADLARLQAQLKALETRSEPKAKAAKPGAPAPAAKAAPKRPGAPAAAPARKAAPAAPRGQAFGWHPSRFAPKSHGAMAHRGGWGRGGFAARGGWGRGGFAARGRGFGGGFARGGFAAPRGHAFAAPRGHMQGGARGFTFGAPGRARTPAARPAAPAVKAPPRGAPPAPPAPAARTPGLAPKPDAGRAPAAPLDADRKLERILKEIEDLRADLKKRR